MQFVYEPQKATNVLSFQVFDVQTSFFYGSTNCRVMGRLH
jgi:hypothetical protein